MPWCNHPTIGTICWSTSTLSTPFLSFPRSTIPIQLPYPVLSCPALSCPVRGCVPAGHVHTGVPLDRRGIHRRREGQGTHLRQQVHQRGTHVHTYTHERILAYLPFLTLMHHSIIVHSCSKNIHLISRPSISAFITTLLYSYLISLLLL